MLSIYINITLYRSLYKKRAGWKSGSRGECWSSLSREPKKKENLSEPRTDHEEKIIIISNSVCFTCQGPNGHRTTSFSVLDILDPNKFTSSRRHPQQHASHRGEREPSAYGVENRRGGAGEQHEPSLDSSKGCYAADEYHSSESSLHGINISSLFAF